jgi:hypothetical protein
MRRTPERVERDKIIKQPLSFNDAVNAACVAFSTMMYSHGFYPLDGELQVKREGPRGTGDTFVVTLKRRYQGNGERVL